MKYRFLKKIYTRLYYILAELIIKIKKESMPPSLLSIRNLFLYFDYEREFSGHDTSICDKDVVKILDLLDKFQIKATWFTVGEIFEEYPGSIYLILSRGHEIGSHTYGHVAPLWASSKIVKKDFGKFNKISMPFTRIIGFHAPNGQWSLDMRKNLRKYGYLYDVVKSKRDDISVSTFSSGFLKNKRLLRLYTKGDDWPLVNKNLSRDSVCKYFESLLDKINSGQLGGIGFHPRVLVSDKKIFEGFDMFLNYLWKQENININTAAYFASEVLMQDMQSL